MSDRLEERTFSYWASYEKCPKSTHIS